MIAHEVPDMVQENLVRKWKLPISLCVFARLLRLRGERPSCRCSTKKSDELASSHCRPEAKDSASYQFGIELWKGLAMSALGHKQTCAPQQAMSALPQ